MNCYKKDILGIRLYFSFQFADTRHYFSCGDSDRLDYLPERFLFISDPEFQEWKRSGGTCDAFGEFCLLCSHISTAMMDHGCFVFHAAAIRYRNRAWLITAPSGVGKTTQCNTLLKAHPGEISIINGDKPFIDLRGSSVMVHPSPWNGKEGLKGAEAAPLAGIFFLQRGTHDTITPCKPADSAILSFISVFQTYEDSMTIKKSADITERMLENTPLWLFTSNNIGKSAEILYSKMKEEVDKIAL